MWSVFTKLKKQLAGQLERPKPKALVLPKSVTFCIPAGVLNVP
jgi:hypothetical protein